MNKKIGKTLLSTLSVAVLSVTSAGAISANEADASSQSVNTTPIQVDQEQMSQPSRYISVTGTIQEITEYGQNQEMQLVTVEGTNGSITRFVVSDKTFVSDELAIGAEIIAFYDANVPVIMIYPPQYSAVVISLVESGRTVKVDRFDETLTSSDGSLKLNISDETEIISSDGSAYTGDLANHDLIVSYGPSTRSIPAQTTPEQVIVLPEEEVLPVDEVEEAEQGPAYGEVRGVIQELGEWDSNSNSQLITVQINENEVVHLVVSKHTYMDDELAEGAEITAFYEKNAPMLMIYPPRYNVDAIALASEDHSLMVDRFDEHLLNSGQSLKLNISEDTEVVTQDGAAFEGDLTNRILFIEYGVVALSYPAQTTPERIVVLDGPDVTKLQEEVQAGAAAVEIIDLNEIEKKSLVVNGSSVDAPSAYIHEQGAAMVPLRAIADALGYELTWESETMTVKVGQAISLQIGQDHYYFAKMAPIELGTAPEVKDGLTYVPLTFFKEVIRAEQVIVGADQIVIEE